VHCGCRLCEISRSYDKNRVEEVIVQSTYFASYCTCSNEHMWLSLSDSYLVPMLPYVKDHRAIT